MLTDIPERLHVMHRHHAIDYGRTFVPGAAIGKIRSNKRGDVAHGVGDEGFPSVSKCWWSLGWIQTGMFREE